MNAPRLLLEIAADNADDAGAAVLLGADRIELCAHLDRHGLSADPAELRRISGAVGGRIVAMARPEPDDVDLSETAFARLCRDAEALLGAGAAGIVFGVVDSSRGIDARRVREVVRLCGGRDTVFHRAFDLVRDRARAIEELVDLGVTRVLTAGQTPDEAEAALALGSRGPFLSPCSEPSRLAVAVGSARCSRIQECVFLARGRIEIIAGGGVRAVNAAEFVRAGCGQLHASCRGSSGTMIGGEVAALRAVLDGPIRETRR